MNVSDAEQAVGSARPSLYEKSHSRQSSISTHPDTENPGDLVTRTQQCRILASTCLMAFTLVGLNQAFGVFQAHYGRKASAIEGVLLQMELSQRPLISAIGSLGNGGLFAAFGVLYYPHLPQLGGHVRYLCGLGTALIAIGFAAAAGSHNLATLVACQGLLVGLGAGIHIYLLGPILPEYFSQRSGLAQGIMFACAALGSTVWVFALTESLETLGIRWTLGILSMFSLAVLSISSALALPPRKFERRSTDIVSWKVFKDPLFASLAVANLVHPLTMAIPMVFGPEFAQSIGTGITHGSYLLAINTGVGIPGRLCTGWLSDKIGHLNMLVVATAVYVIATWAFWLSAAMTSNVGLYIGMSVCHGLSNGVFNVVINSAQKMLFGSEMYYPKSGMMTSIRGVGFVISAPIAGALVSRVADIDLQGRDFVRLIVYTGTLLTISLFCLLNVRWLDAKKNGWKLVR
ncbi:major facilitator superfamily domain-containing protein [Alternaria rosae]|uniref:major facilitator superfamily domain-containing protein n=1 Tax=Alternaria rosae TaxID=1187941 RepID=UPI001E8E7C5A|nr:major facilitator superfamily domain-containing protein [Alternaria rosae]KAH6870765.1 major facilitator superfamily domain-containing protein [Alternaria rosae]